MREIGRWLRQGVDCDPSRQARLGFGGGIGFRV